MSNYRSVQKLAKQAGILYLLIAILVFWGIVYVPSQIMVKGNLAGTINNVLERETLFRSGIVCQLVSNVKCAQVKY